MAYENTARGRTMDFYDQRRYRINKLLQRCIGIWPYQEKGESYFFLGLALCCQSSLLSVQIRKTIIDYDDKQVLMETIPILLVQLICYVNVINSVINTKELREILNCIQEDFKTLRGTGNEILVQIANQGRLFVIAYIAYMFTAATIFMLVPAAPKIIVAFGLANISAKAQFSFPVDYIVDSEEYYFYLQIHFFFTVYVVMVELVAADCLFIMVLQHGCGIFAVLCYRLEHLIEDGNLNYELYPDLIADESYWTLIDCIKKHHSAILFFELIDATYTWQLFCFVGVNMLIMSFSGYQMSISITNNEYDQALMQAVLVLGQVLHVFIECFFCQRLTDYSYGVYKSLNQLRWYKTSMRSRKLVNFMLMRSTEPCELKAGNMYTMSMENFSSIVQTSVSYFTVMRSMQ